MLQLAPEEGLRRPRTCERDPVTAAQKLVAWFEGNSWRSQCAARAEAHVRASNPELEPGSDEFYTEVLKVAKSIT